MLAFKTLKVMLIKQFFYYKYKSVKIIFDVVEAASPFCTKKLLVFRPTVNFALNCRLVRTFHVPHTVIAF